MHLAFKAENGDTVIVDSSPARFARGMPHTHRLGLEYGCAIFRALTQQAVRKQLAPIDRQRGTWPEIIQGRRIGAVWRVHAPVDVPAFALIDTLPCLFHPIRQWLLAHAYAGTRYPRLSNRQLHSIPPPARFQKVPDSSQTPTAWRNLRPAHCRRWFRDVRRNNEIHRGIWTTGIVLAGSNSSAEPRVSRPDFCV